MQDVQLARAPIASGQEERLCAWFTELGEREPEVIETLDHEGVYTESAFIHREGANAYLYIYMEAKNMREAVEAGETESFAVDKEHHELLRDTLADRFVMLETIGHFTNPGLR